MGVTVAAILTTKGWIGSETDCAPVEGGDETVILTIGLGRRETQPDT